MKIKRPSKLSIILVTIPAIALIIVQFGGILRSNRIEERMQLIVAGSNDGFARAAGPRTLQFPSDHGPHPDFQTEWWCYTGNLETTDGHHRRTPLWI